MFLRIYSRTESSSKTYNWYLPEPPKPRKNSVQPAASENLLWGMPRDQVAEYGMEIGNLLIFILKR